MLAPTPILSLEGRKELAASLWTSLAQGWSFMCTISWWMPILLEKAIARPIFGHPSPCPVLAGAFVTRSAPWGQHEDGVSGYLGDGQLQRQQGCAWGHGRVQGSEGGCESHRPGGAPCHGEEEWGTCGVRHALAVPYEGCFLLQLSQKQRIATAAPFEGHPCAGEASEPPAPRKGGQQVSDWGLRRGSLCREEEPGSWWLCLSMNSGKRWRSAWSQHRGFDWKSMFSETVQISNSSKRPLGLKLSIVSNPFHCSDVNLCCWSEPSILGCTVSSFPVNFSWTPLNSQGKWHLWNPCEEEDHGSVPL